MAKLAKKQTNQLGKRSKEILTKTFFDLIEEHPTKPIQIKTLCEKARISRPTFYAHYNRIEDIPQVYFCQWLEDVEIWVDQFTQEKPSPSRIPDNQYSFYGLLFGYWCNKVEIVKSLQNAGYENVILQCFIQAHKLAMKNLVGPNFDLPIDFQKFLQSKGAIVAYELYKYWIATDMQLTVEQLTEINFHLNTKQEIIEFRRISMGEPENKVA